MQVNIYKDRLLDARLFGASVLYSTQPIPREDVPEGWYCYDLRGTDRQPDEPYALVDRAEDCHAGSVLSYLPLKSGRSRGKLVWDMFQMTGTSSTLADFCRQERIRFPRPPIRFMLRPASPEESGYFYAQAPEKDEDMGAIGHVRIDFGRSGKEFWHTWWPRGPQELNTPKFKEELGTVVDDLRKGVLKDLSSMRRYCNGGTDPRPGYDDGRDAVRIAAAQRGGWTLFRPPRPLSPTRPAVRPCVPSLEEGWTPSPPQALARGVCPPVRGQKRPCGGDEKCAG